MTPQDAELIVAIAALAAQADGKQDDAERQRIAEMAAGLGLSDNSALLAGDMAAKVGTHAALAISEMYPGTTFWVPSVPTAVTSVSCRPGISRTCPT